MTTDRAMFALEVRLADAGDGRTVEGIAVPYGQTTDLTAAGSERFAAGSLSKTVSDWQKARRRLPLLRAHDPAHPIGKVVEYRHTTDGLHIAAHLADTPLGNEALAEVRAGVLDAFSIGFRAIHATRTADGVREIREAALHELSLVPIPAYAGAEVLAVRAAAAGRTVPTAPRIPARMLGNVTGLR